MRLTILGKSPAWSDAGGACSGYLVESDQTKLLVDCGNGVFGKLRERLDYTEVDAVVVSHLHADHILDLFPYAYGLTYAPRQQPVPVGGWPGTDDPARPALHVPPGGRELFRRFASEWGNEALVEEAFDLSEYDPSRELAIGDLTVRFGMVPHFMDTYALDIEGPGGARITYGADSSPSDELVEFARGTDLLIVEATLPRPERTGVRGHLTPGEAGDHARRAGARAAILTHISDELDEGWARREASEAFGAPVDVAREGAVYEIGG